MKRRGFVRAVFNEQSDDWNNASRGTGVSPTWERALQYTLMFAGLIAVLVAVSGLLGLTGLAFSQLRDLVNPTDTKNEAGIYLATFIVAAPVWLGLGYFIRQRLERTEVERRSVERRLFLAAVFAVTGVVSLFSLQELLRTLLTLPGTNDQAQSAKDAFSSSTRLIVFGVAWLVYARVSWREIARGAADFARDLGIYILAGFALIVLSVGIGDAVEHLVYTLQGTTANYLAPFSANAPWTVWGEVASWLLAGGAVWGAIWRYDLARGGRRRVRVVYLYIVLLAATPTTLVAGGAILGEWLRRVFGYQSFPDNWDFLHASVPVLVAAGVVWAYHWTVVRRQATIYSAIASPRGKIVWPRRPFLALLSLGGLTAASIGFVSLVWVAIDALLSTHSAVLGGDWWRDQLSWSMTTVVVGCLVWIPTWWLLRHAAVVDPEHERVATERRWLLGAVVLGSALAGIGFSIAALFQLITVILQTTNDNTLSDSLHYLGVAFLAVGIGIYHWMLFRSDQRLRGPKHIRAHVVAFLVPGAEATVTELARRTRHHIELMGYLQPSQVTPTMDLPTLERELTALGREGTPNRAFLVLRSDGGELVTYSKEYPAATAIGAVAPTVQAEVVSTGTGGVDRSLTSR